MAVFSYRTEEIRPEAIKDLFVETKADRRTIEEIRSQSPTIIEGSRGTGKSFLLKIAEKEMNERYDVDRILPVYLSFKESSLVQSQEKNRFLYWMMAKLCAQTTRAMRAKGLLEPSLASLTLMRGRRKVQAADLSEIAEKFEESWRNPSGHIDTSSIPDIDDYVQAVEEICEFGGVERICLLFDEAAHVFRLEQQHAFFSLFRDLRSPRITCNAAVYPGITSYGPSFEMAHDATLIRLERNILDPEYVNSMREMVIKQAERKAKNSSGDDKDKAEKLLRQSERPAGNFEKNFPLLAYSAHGNPRHLLKTVNSLNDLKQTDVENVIKEYYRQDIWKEHSALGEKFTSYKSVVDWGRDFVEINVVPMLNERNQNPELRGTVETTSFFWVSRDVPEEINKSLSLLSYVGLVQELDKAVRATRSQLGTRYTVHLGTLLAQAANPLKELERIMPKLSKKRMIEFGPKHSVFEKVAFKKVVSEDMLSATVVRQQLNRSVDVLDLSDWQKKTLKGNGYGIVENILQAGEEALRSNIRGIGEVRSRQIVNAAKSAILEYLLG
ncbi:hypothetical protein ACIU1J_04815 [Azospirillum doebereinerae]|uniref:ORC-CDC6 family AAA ATPase n=1 Tax=Azospirillum doebereinerae TaxID=92933 RepID=UPI001EE55B9A|nr:hypothetical protein [Azospirillum doebereinerae]MCG5243319.1 hypothetical protein [Azospirillum doebereinerae]